MSATQSATGAIDSSKDLLCINTIRTLSMDAVQAAKSGHPGTPMALAPVVYTLWNRVMQFDPQDPIFDAAVVHLAFDRDASRECGV